MEGVKVVIQSGSREAAHGVLPERRREGKRGAVKARGEVKIGGEKARGRGDVKMFKAA